MTMRLLHDAARPGRDAPAVAILLPGALQRPEDLVEAGFIDAVRRRGLALDLMLADLDLAHVGEAADGTALRRIDEQILRPARRRYQAVWVAGISIGGMLAMACAARYPGLIDGLCLIAPYPGNRTLAAEITAAGGATRWHAAQAERPEQDDERRVWRWLAAESSRPDIHLGFGADDRFAAGQRLAAGFLTNARTDIIPGGHDMQTWLQLWENFLDASVQRFSGNLGGSGVPCQRIAPPPIARSGVAASADGVLRNDAATGDNTGIAPDGRKDRTR